MGLNWKSCDLQSDVDAPEWDDAERIHDWRNHVGKRARALWDQFTPEQRLALAKDADDLASQEEWD